jgi:Cft2 family RNA processing exonuclease
VLIQNLNPDTEIGASAWWVVLDGHRLLLDAGTHPKREGAASLPLYGLVRAQDLDAIAISHCHHDHVGSLPVALQHFPAAHVLMTELSYFLVERILHNSVNVMKRQRENLGIREYPLFTHEQVDDLAPVFQGFKYNREVEWASFSRPRDDAPSPTLEFFDAGHTLGSSGILVRGFRQTLFYTGDVCFRDQTVLRGARFGGVKADVLIMETTRGGRSAGPDYSRETESERLAAAIEKVLHRGGSVLIPSFALGRTQEILALLALLMDGGRIRKQPVYIGGLGRVFTEIYDLQSHRGNRLHPELQLHDSLNLVVLDPKKAGEIKLTGRHLFVLTAGMMTENTAAHDMAWRMLGDARHGVFFVGYADPETPGGRLKSSRLGETFMFSGISGAVERQCEVEEFDLTAHAQREDLLDFVGQVDPHSVVLGHGDAAARAWFDGQIRHRHPRIKVLQPGPGETVEI